MAVQNRLAKAPEQERGTTEYECGGQMVKISPNLVIKYLVNGNGSVTEQEVMMFISMCKYQKLNPFLREAYLIKYGTNPATIVTGKEAFLKRAMRNPRYAGMEAGVVVLEPANDAIEHRVGTIVVEGEQLLGGWARVYVRGWEKPLMVTVAFDEYCQKKDGKPISNWATRPATMIRKVALVQALREAFPEDLGGMHAPEEVGIADADLPLEPIAEDVFEAEVVADDPQSVKCTEWPAGDSHIGKRAEAPEPSAADALFGK